MNNEEKESIAETLRRLFIKTDSRIGEIRAEMKILEEIKTRIEEILAIGGFEKTSNANCIHPEQ